MLSSHYSLEIIIFNLDCYCLNKINCSKIKEKFPMNQISLILSFSIQNLFLFVLLCSMQNKQTWKNAKSTVEIKITSMVSVLLTWQNKRILFNDFAFYTYVRFFAFTAQAFGFCNNRPNLSSCYFCKCKNSITH